MRLIVGVMGTDPAFYADMAAEGNVALATLNMGEGGARILAIELEDGRYGWLEGTEGGEAGRALEQAAALLDHYAPGEATWLSIRLRDVAEGWKAQPRLPEPVQPTLGSKSIGLRAWLLLPKSERLRRVAAFKKADAALQAYNPPGKTEDGTYHRLNGEVNRLWPTVPWWHHW